MPAQLADANPIMLVLSIVIQVFVLSLGIYYVSISIFAWIPKKERPDVRNELFNYALVVAAHNEEAVIKQMVESLKRLNFPTTNYDIFVIADNCTDKTAEVARTAGAYVHERENKKERGKGYALEWMYNNIFKMDKQYDYICVFDADNVVSSNFLTEMNKQHNKGYDVVQGNIDSKNPFDSWISCAYSISFWAVGRLYQMARYNINLSCQLCGTGFSVGTKLLKELGWGATCLTEDLEFSAKLLLNNQRVGWAHYAVVYDEKPLTVTQSWKQRKRWMQGHADVASRFLIPLFKKAFTEKDPVAFDCAIYLLQPLKVLALGVVTLMAWIQTLYPDGHIGFFQIWYLFKDPVLWWAYLSCSFLYVPLTITYEKKMLNMKLIVAYATYWIYSLTWIPITVLGIMDKNKKEWFHTQHTRSIEITEVEKA